MSGHNKLIFMIGLAGALGLVFVVRGCGRYGEVGTEAYGHANALYSVCNRQDADGLERFSTHLAQARETGTITKKEYNWLNDIVGTARSGDWREATLQSRQLLEDQVQGGP